MKISVRLNNIPNQEGSFNITIGNTVLACNFKLRTLTDNSLIMDLIINGKVMFYGKKCITNMPLIYNNALGGNFYWFDKYGNENPNYVNFNDRFLLIFDTEYKI